MRPLFLCVKFVKNGQIWRIGQNLRGECLKSFCVYDSPRLYLNIKICRECRLTMYNFLVPTTIFRNSHLNSCVCFLRVSFCSLTRLISVSKALTRPSAALTASTASLSSPRESPACFVKFQICDEFENFGSKLHVLIFDEMIFPDSFCIIILSNNIAYICVCM